jgi:hypothetical protein
MSLPITKVLSFLFLVKPKIFDFVIYHALQHEEFGVNYRVSIPNENKLSNPAVWSKLQRGDLILTDVFPRREALLVVSVAENKIETKKLSTGYYHTINIEDSNKYWV